MPQRWVVSANWKLGTDNFIGDDYHVAITHRSVMDAGTLPVPNPDFLFDAVQFVAGPGGGAFAKMLYTLLGYPAAMVEAFKRNLTPAQAQLVEQGLFLGNGALFPNLSFLNAPASLQPGGPMVPYFTLRVWRPLGPDRDLVMVPGRKRRSALVLGRSSWWVRLLTMPPPVCSFSATPAPRLGASIYGWWGWCWRKMAKS